MSDPKISLSSEKKLVNFGLNQLSLTIISLFALIFTFLLSGLDLNIASKAVVFSGIVVLYLAVVALIYRKQKKKAEEIAVIIEKEEKHELFTNEVENRLKALEEANDLFGASIKPSDMFRLVASRVNELIPNLTCVLFLAVDGVERLKIEFADGKNAQLFRHLEINTLKGNAGKVFLTRKPQIDANLLLEKNVFPEAVLEELSCAVAVPLMRDGRVFGVLQLYGDAIKRFNEDSVALLEAVAVRVTPLFMNSLAHEQTLSNALTDALTHLPNERAFYLVLENQLAESQRYRLERSLTILTIDISNFADVNKKYGHATGDRILSFAGQIIKAQLREMDFLARSVGDEFWIVLPTASEKISNEVAERVEKSFITKPFVISNDEKIFLKLNFGSATFGQDGETASELLQTAIIKKQQGKHNAEAAKIIFFPRDYVN